MPGATPTSAVPTPAPEAGADDVFALGPDHEQVVFSDRKSTRLNSSHPV